MPKNLMPEFALSLTRLLRVSTASTILLAGGLATSSPAWADRAIDQTETVAPSQVDSVFGAYAAAGYAESIYDFDRAARLLDRVLETQPDDPLLQRRGMLASLHAGRVRRATELARPQVAVYPSEVDIAALTLAADAIKREEWTRAADILKPARRVALAQYSAPILAAWADFGAGDTDGAIETLSPLRDDAQAASLHDFHAALIFLAAERFAEADAILTPQADRLEDMPIGVLRALARARLGNGDPEGAEDLLKGYRAFNPGNTFVDEDIALLDAGDPLPPMVKSPQEGSAEALIDLARQIRDQAPLIALRYSRLGSYLSPENDLGHMVTGTILQRLDRYEEAITALRNIKIGSLFDWDARMDIADNLIRLDRDAEAIDSLEAMAAERPDDIEALDKLGFLMRVRGRFEEGTGYYDRAMERIDVVTQDHWTLFYFRGITLERTKRWPEAESDFKRSLELKPDDPYVLNYLGYSWIDQGVNIEEGMEMIRNAVSQRRNDGNVVDSLGWAHYRLGEFDEAVVHLERAVQLRPEEAVINDHLGDAYWKVGRRLEASFQWRHALSLDPDDDLREVIEQKLDEGLDAVEAETE